MIIYIYSFTKRKVSYLHFHYPKVNSMVIWVNIISDTISSMYTDNTVLRVGGKRGRGLGGGGQERKGDFCNSVNNKK